MNESIQVLANIQSSDVLWIAAFVLAFLAPILFVLWSRKRWASKLIEQPTDGHADHTATGEFKPLQILGRYAVALVWWLMFITFGWPFTLFLWMRTRNARADFLERERAERDVRSCPSCGREVAMRTPVCPRCEHRFLSK